MIFAWRVVTAKAYGDSVIKAAESAPITVPVSAIYPMTGVSRIVYLLEVRPPIGAEALRRLQAANIGSVEFWELLRTFVVFLVVLGISCCAVTEWFRMRAAQIYGIKLVVPLIK